MCAKQEIAAMNLYGAMGSGVFYRRSIYGTFQAKNAPKIND